MRGRRSRRCTKVKTEGKESEGKRDLSRMKTVPKTADCPLLSIYPTNGAPIKNKHQYSVQDGVVEALYKITG